MPVIDSPLKEQIWRKSYNQHFLLVSLLHQRYIWIKPLRTYLSCFLSAIVILLLAKQIHSLITLLKFTPKIKNSNSTPAVFSTQGKKSSNRKANCAVITNCDDLLHLLRRIRGSTPRPNNLILENFLISLLKDHDTPPSLIIFTKISCIIAVMNILLYETAFYQCKSQNYHFGLNSNVDLRTSWKCSPEEGNIEPSSLPTGPFWD